MAGPLFLGLAKVVIPPGVGTDAGDAPGPRLLAVESGRLTVVTTRASSVIAVPGPGEPGGRHDLGAGTIDVNPGERLALPAGGAREIRNDGARPAVFLDAAVFPPGPEPVRPAFTTPDGIVFQLRAGAAVAEIPAGPLRVTLARVRLGRGGALPAGPWPGPALAYVDSGALAVMPTGGEVRAGRAAAAVPGSAAGALRPVPRGDHLTVTAGGAVVLSTGAAARAGNERDTPAELLLLAVAPAE